MSNDSAASMTFRVEGLGEGSGKPITVHGVVDEHADLSFFTQLAGPVQINLKGLRRINSFGVRAWIDAIRKLAPDAELEFVECSPAVVDQINMVAGFLGRGKVRSFYAPMTCERCDVEEDRLFQVADCMRNGGRLPSVPCAGCGQPMEMDDVEEQYLLFVREA